MSVIATRYECEIRKRERADESGDIRENEIVYSRNNDRQKYMGERTEHVHYDYFTHLAADICSYTHTHTRGVLRCNIYVRLCQYRFYFYAFDCY